MASKPDNWNRCQECGQFIALEEFVRGAATHRLLEPDSALGVEKWDTHHNRCVEACEWSEIEADSGIYNTCRPGEEFHLTEGLELWPHCHFCGKPIEVVSLSREYAGQKS